MLTTNFQTGTKVERKILTELKKNSRKKKYQKRFKYALVNGRKWIIQFVFPIKAILWNIKKKKLLINHESVFLFKVYKNNIKAKSLPYHNIAALKRYMPFELGIIRTIIVYTRVE